jgi:hypothetical protein
MKLMTIDAFEFVRRFLMHVLPDRFVRIRYYGFLANSRRRQSIERARELIGQDEPLQFRERPKLRVLCPACLAVAESERRPQPSRHGDRSPPLKANAA